MKKYFLPFLIVLVLIPTGVMAEDINLEDMTQEEQISYLAETVISLNERIEELEEENEKIINILEEAGLIDDEDQDEETESEVSDEEIPSQGENALRNAEQYLDYTAFSKEGLYDQLLFEQYPEDAARYAVESLDVDWKEQAVYAGENYLEYSPFSKEGLYEQLIYEEFTEEEARYAVDLLFN